MRIAIISFTYLHWFGGAERYVYLTAKNLAKLGHKVTIYTAKIPRLSEFQRIEEEAFKIVKIPVFFHVDQRIGNIWFFSKKNLELWFVKLASFRLLLDHFINHKNDIIYGQAVNALAGISIRKYTNVPVLVASLNYKWARFTEIQNSVIQHSDGLITLNENALNEHLKSIGRSMPRSEVIYIGINVNEFSPKNKDEKYRIKLGLKKDDLMLLTLQRMDGRKDLFPLMKAFVELASKNSKLRVFIGGGGPDKEKYKKWAESKGFLKYLRFLDFIPDLELPLIYAAADIFIAASYGYVTLEAMASETATIVIDHEPQCSEYVEDGKSGFLVKEEPKAILKKIEPLIKSETLRKRIAKNGRDYVQEKFDEVNNAKKIALFMEKIIKHHNT